MLADRDPLEGRAPVLDLRADQAEVGRAAADVADQDQRSPGEALRQLRRCARSTRRAPPAALRAGSAARGPACCAASTVSSRASSSNDAGTVSTILLLEPRGVAARACSWFQASRMCASSRADASTGDSLGRRLAPQGRSAAVRSTRGFDSQDFADAISRDGTSAPSSRAKTPATRSGVGPTAADGPETRCPCSVK